jgi:hypothetical protein
MLMNGIPLPVLALDAGEIFGIIFLVLSVLGWFVKAIKGQGGNAAPPARRQAPEMRRTEIETFLDEISGGAPRKPPVRATPPNRPGNKPRAQNVAQAKQPNKPAAKPQKKPPKPFAALADQHLAKSNVGEGLRAHVSSFNKAERIPAESEQYLKSRIAAEVRTDLGAGTFTAQPTSVERAAVHPLVALLRDPVGIRQAITLQEILQPPKALRRR